jgi:hypothetical protein
MKRERYLVHDFATNVDREAAPANERSRFNGAAQRDNANMIAVLDL